MKIEMQLIRGLSHIPPLAHSVVAIGNFDGIHLAHQEILKQLKVLSQQHQVPSVLIIFEPTPAEYFLKEKAPARLMRLREKILGLKSYNIDYVLCLKFNKELSILSSELFIENLLIKKLGMKAIIIGDDFHFGAARRGDLKMLSEWGLQEDFEVQVLKDFNFNQGRVSSTRIREALLQGDLNLAKALLGKPYSVCGRVSHGHQRGRSIGFPTANIHLHRQNVPISGVFAVRVLGLDKIYNGVANIGVRPTVDGSNRILLEVFIFNFDQVIYGHYVEIQFLHKLRDEQRYNDFEALRAQIEKDVLEAKAYFSTLK